MHFADRNSLVSLFLSHMNHLKVGSDPKSLSEGNLTILALHL